MIEESNEDFAARMRALRQEGPDPLSTALFLLQSAAQRNLDFYAVISGMPQKLRDALGITSLNATNDAFMSSRKLSFRADNRQVVIPEGTTFLPF